VDLSEALIKDDLIAAEHRPLVRLAEGSVIARAIDRGASAVERAYLHSRVRALLLPWLTLTGPADERRRWFGLMLLTAVAVHVALLLGRSQGAGWRNLVIPAVMAAQGALLVIASRAGRRG
jgi:hypothetical protein